MFAINRMIDIRSVYLKRVRFIEAVKKMNHFLIQHKFSQIQIYIVLQLRHRVNFPETIYHFLLFIIDL